MDHPGNLFVVSAPSGTGKSSLVKALLELDSRLQVSISHTTRAPRGQEQHGREYWFISQDEFRQMIDRGEFFEHAEVHGNCYGTSRPWIEAEMAAGRDVLLEIDWQGAQQVRRLFPGAIGVFVLPPSMAELERRLTGRGTDSAEVIAARMERARAEISHWDGYDYVVVNDDVEACYDQVCEILHAERMRRARQTGLIGFVRELMRD